MSKLISMLRKSRIASATLALVLAFSVLLSTFGGLAIFAENGSSVIDIWDGSRTEPTKGGDGSAADKAILIETPEELAWVVYAGGAGKYYKLTNDLYLNDVEKINWTNGDIADGYALKNWYEVSSVSEVSVFTGHIDGDGHTVYGMYSTCSPTAYYWSQGGIGLITKATNGEVSIKNLGIDTAFVHNISHAAAIIGSTSGNTSAVTVDSCYVGENVTLIGYGSGAIVSTAVNAANVTVSNCYSVATLTTKGGYAGLMSEFYDTGSRVVKNSFNANGPITASQSLAAGSENNYETVKGSSTANATLRTSDNMKGADVLTSDTKMPNLGEGWTAMGDGKYPVPNAFVPASAEIDIWDGTDTTAPTKGGDGSSAEQAILIETPEEFANVIVNGGAGKYYKLENDLYFNKVDKVDWSTGEAAEGYTPNAWYSSANIFTGTIDGAGHKIYGLYLNKSGADWSYDGAGLVPNARNGEVTIKNLGIEKSYIRNNTYAGGFIGSASGNTSKVTVDSCYTGAEVTVKGYGGAAIIGNTVNAADVVVTNCYNLGTTVATAEGEVGLIGSTWGSNFKTTVKNSYNANGPISTKNLTDGTSECADNYSTVAGNGSTKTTVIADAANMKGADVLVNAAKMPNLGSAYVAVGDGEYPILAVFAEEAEEEEEKPLDIWDGTDTTAPTKGGDGSAADKAIIIETPEEFANVIANGGAGKYYKLANDIYLNAPDAADWATGTKNADTVNEWYRNKAFNGTIDGDGHTVYGMYINTNPSSYGAGYDAGVGAGLIPVVGANAEVTVKNLMLDKAYVNVKCQGAAIVGTIASSAKAFTADSVAVGADVYVKGADAGAFVSMNLGGGAPKAITLTNCYNLGTIASQTSNTGFFGDTWTTPTTITNCYNATGPISKKAANVTTTTNSYALEGTGDTVGATPVSEENMKGANVLTDAAKMPNLGSAYIAVGDGKYPTLAIFVTGSDDDDEPDTPALDIWDGTTVAPTKGGDGSAADKAILIETPEELANVIKTGGAGKYYKLANDIYLNAPDAVDWATGTVNGTIQDWGKLLKDAAVFTGHIDGDGHTVYGIYVEHGNTAYGYSTTSGYGLIGKATSGAVSIKNLGIDKAYVHTATHNAAFIGTAAGNTAEVVIDSCYVGADVKIVGAGAAAFIGMAVNSTSTLISNSYNLGTMVAKGGTELGGYIGFMSEFYGAGSRVVKNSYNANGPISGGQSVAGSENNYETVAGSASANATLRSADNMKGADVLTSADKMKNLGEAWTEMGDGKYPVPWAFSGKTGPTTPDEPEDLGYWTGEKKPTKGGDGSSADKAILIETANEFAYVIKNGGENKYYKLSKDIYLNDVSKINWADGTKLDDAYTVRNWGALTQVAFSGTIDGDGHTIYGMYNNEYPSQYHEDGGFGLIKRIATGKTATLKNLGLDKSFNHSVGYAAGFVGVMPDGGSLIFENCYVGAEVIIKGHNASAFLATGKLGNPSVSILNCYSLATQEAKGTKNAYAGLVGDFWTGSIVVKNSYNAKGYVYNKNDITASNNYGLEAGKTAAATTVLTEDNMKGADVLINPDKMPNLGEGWTDMGDGKYPVPWIFSGKAKPLPDYFSGWDGSTTKPTTGGDGSSEQEAIIIGTAAELAYVIKNGGEGKYYKLSNDIALNDVNKIDWTTGTRITTSYVINSWFSRAEVEPFYGTIDGDGYTIYGLLASEYNGTYSESANTGTALIPKATSGKDITIKNLSIDCAYVHSGTNAAAFVGYTQGAGTTISFDRCYVGKNVTVAGKQAAAFVGASTFNPELPEEQRKAPTIVITSCYNLGTLTKEGTGNSFRGFVGDSWGAPVSVTKSYNATGPIYEKSTSGVCANNYETVAGNANTKAELRTPDMMKGADVLENLSKMPKLGKQYVANENDYPSFTAIPAVDNTWDGFTRTEPKDTDGDGFIEINNAEEFAYMVYSGGEGKKYLLTADIYLNDVARPNWQNYDVNPWFIWSVEGADASRAFKGYVEGNGHTVYGLYRNDEVPQCTDQKNNWKGSGVGLFPILSTDATIRNIHVRESYISANAAVGAIAGKTYRFKAEDESKQEEQKKKKATIIGCSADESVTLHGWIVGGLVGGSSDCGVNIYYSYSTVNYSNTGLEGFANAFIGDIWTASNEIVDSYYVGANGARGSFSYITSYGTGTTKEANGLKIVSKAAMTGARAKSAMKNLDWTVWYTVNGDTPHLKVVPAGQNPPAAGEGRPGRKWYGLIASGFNGGTGTKNDPYLIATPEQLAYLVTNLWQFDTNTYYKITHDIILNDTSYKGWEEEAFKWYNGWRAPFVGHLDGGGHVISGLYINDEQPNYSALFSIMNHDSSIRRLGIINSKIIAGDGDAAMCAPLIAFVEHWAPSKNPQYKMPEISECFADSTVYVEGNNVGGLVAGAPSPIKLENCYSTAELFGVSSKSRGALIGGAWGNDGGPTLIGCYGTNTNRDRLVAGNGGSAGYMVSGSSSAVNCYIDGPGAGNYIKSTIIEYMKGNNAKEYMPGLDYDKVWKIVDGGTPVLRCFKNAEKYSCKRELQKVEITFVTNGGNELEKMSGYPRLDKLSADDLPTPKRYGYKFAGWYYFSQLDLPFELDCYPDFDINLYAKWEPVGFTVTFENTPDPVYDYNSGVVQLKPGVKGYSPRYAHSGVKSMHTLPDSKTAPMFLISYENTVEVGKEYEINFWVTTDTANQSGEVRLVHVQYGDVHDVVVGDETAFEYSGMIPGVWKKYTAKIVANAPYLLVKAPVGASLYFDDIQVVPTGEEGKLGQIDNYKPVGALGGMNLVLILCIAGGVILLGGAAVVVAIVIKKRKTKTL